MHDRRRHHRFRILFMEFDRFWNRMILGRLLNIRRGRKRWTAR